MSNPDPYEDLDEQPERNSTVRHLRAQIDERDAELADLRTQAERTATLERKVALYEANLGNLNEDQQKAVLATATEMTADALRSQAERLNFIDPPAPAVPAADISAHDRVAEAIAGASPPNADDVYAAELDAARTPEEVEAVMVRHTGDGFYQGQDGTESTA